MTDTPRQHITHTHTKKKRQKKNQQQTDEDLLLPELYSASPNSP